MSESHNSYDYEIIGGLCSQEIHNKNQDEILCEVSGYTRSNTRLFLYHLFAIVLLGFPYVLFESFPKLKARAKYQKCSLVNATKLLVRNCHNVYSFSNVQSQRLNVPNIGCTDLRFFHHEHTKYVWVSHLGVFATIDDLVPPSTVDDYLSNTNGLCEADYNDLSKFYGLNKISVEIKSYWKLFKEEVFNLFYMFQGFSVVLWTFDDYITYAGCVVFLALFSTITSLLETRKQSVAVHNLVESSKCDEVKVLRQNSLQESLLENIDPAELVPGDLIVLPAANFIMPCDAVLLTGQCIVNESVLTGESVPVTKTALHSSTEFYSPDSHRRQTLFSGTTMIQTRYYGGEHVLARVVRTGFDTTKGALVKSILFPAPAGLEFYKDVLKFVMVLFIIATTGMVYCLYLYIIRRAPIREIIIRTLDIITIVVPPALPAAMSIGTGYSQSRLKELGIYCISPTRINICGKVNLTCFDKTGTLTHDGLNMNSVLPSFEANFTKTVTDICDLDVKSKFVQGMATCHSLTRIKGEITGDPLDMNMFEFTKWQLEEPGEDENARYDMLAPTVVTPGKNCAKQLAGTGDPELPYQVGIIREFPFSSTLQCMSVICRDLETPHMMAFTKGAPEKLQGMCLSHSIPKDFYQCLSEYTARGYRVIALGYKDLPKKFRWKEAQKTKRDVIECDLIFLGFLIMQNPLKEETTPIINYLHNANIRTVMITGDNTLTAISVARDCGMVKPHDKIFLLNTDNHEDPDVIPKLIIQEANTATIVDNIAISFNSDHCHFAIDGKTWNKLKYYYSDLLPTILVHSTIFARFQPDQKTQLVSELQKLDYCVAMVGDGANDCGALKAAHVGVSLSQAEASVAAPFTSSIPNISCIVHLILEGRCALVTSFAIFKYMALYSLIQFCTILILYKNRSLLGDFQFLFIDLVITTVLAVTIGRQGPSTKLSTKRPMSTLVSAKNIIPVILQVLTCGLVQLAALYYLYQQKWFKPIPLLVVEEVILSWENTVLFTVSCFQYVILATVYSKGRPYRQMLITNTWFLLSALVLTSFITWMTVYPCKKLAEIMDLMYIPHKAHEQYIFRFTLLAFPILHFLLAGFIEMGIGDRLWLKKLLQIFKCKTTSKHKYKRLLRGNNLEYLFNNDNNLVHIR